MGLRRISSKSIKSPAYYYRFHFSYVNYSNIAARVVRQALKADLRAEAARRNESHVKFTPWTDGKPARKYPFPFT